jgi:hypothetical protein
VNDQLATPFDPCIRRFQGHGVPAVPGHSPATVPTPVNWEIMSLWDAGHTSPRASRCPVVTE